MTKLTAAQIAAMPAGRELDALVAEKVMNYRWEQWETGHGLFAPDGTKVAKRFKTNRMRLELAPSPGAECVPTRPLEEFSSDISDAMDVKEKMRKDGFNFSMFESAAGFIRVSFICSSGPCEKHGNFQHNHHGAYDVEAKTAPLAICRAALAALKVSLEKS